MRSGRGIRAASGVSWTHAGFSVRWPGVVGRGRRSRNSSDTRGHEHCLISLHCCEIQNAVFSFFNSFRGSIALIGFDNAGLAL